MNLMLRFFVAVALLVVLLEMPKIFRTPATTSEALSGRVGCWQPYIFRTLMTGSPERSFKVRSCPSEYFEQRGC